MPGEIMRIKEQSTMDKKELTIAFDLYQLRYVIKNKWYETHDVLRDYLKSKGITVEYTDDDLFCDKCSLKDFCKRLEDERKNEK